MLQPARSRRLNLFSETKNQKIRMHQTLRVGLLNFRNDDVLLLAGDRAAVASLGMQGYFGRPIFCLQNLKMQKSARRLYSAHYVAPTNTVNESSAALALEAALPAKATGD